MELAGFCYSVFCHSCGFESALYPRFCRSQHKAINPSSCENLLESGRHLATVNRMRASNRQRKILTFFKVSHSAELSIGAAGWEIAQILEIPENRDLWRRYVYLTNDFDCTSSELKSYTEADFQSVQIPDDWSASAAAKEFREEIVAGELADHSPFDLPEPEIEFCGRAFLFTGKFSFGTRKQCQSEVASRGGRAPSLKNVNSEIDYLVIGNKGNSMWKKGSYGIKIEEAVFLRRGSGRPAIISEDHWTLSLLQNAN